MVSTSLTLSHTLFSNPTNARTKSKDSSHTYIHLSQPRIADLFEVKPPQPIPSFPSPPSKLTPPHQQEFNRPPTLPLEEIYVPPHHQPPNPEDEDDVVPDQHAAFGITRATQGRREAAWRDLGLQGLVSGMGKVGISGEVEQGAGGKRRFLPR